MLNKSIYAWLLTVILSLLLSGCSFRLLEPNPALSQYHWKVIGTNNIAEYTKVWLLPLSDQNKPVRILSIAEPQRRRRIIALNESGQTSQYLHETVSEVRLEDEDGAKIDHLRLFAVRQYSEDVDVNQYLGRLNEEMDRELSQQLQAWLQNITIAHSNQN